MLKKIPFILPKYINCWMPHQFTKRKFLYSRHIATWYVQWNLAHFSSGTQLMFYSKHGPPSNFPPTSKFSQDNFSCLPVPCKKCIFTCNMNMRWWRWMILQLCTGRQQKQTSYFPLRSNLFQFEAPSRCSLHPVPPRSWPFHQRRQEIQTILFFSSHFRPIGTVVPSLLCQCTQL